MRLLKWAQVSAICCLILGSASVSFGQGGRGPGGGGMMMGGRMGGGGGGVFSIIRMEEVRKELKVDDEASKKLEAIQKDMGDEMMKASPFGQGGGGFRDMSDEERTKKMEEFAKVSAEISKKYEAKLDEILDPDQSDRLIGLLVQRENARAILSSTKVATAVEADQAVKDKLTAVNKAASEDMMKMMRPADGGQPDFAGMREKMEKARKETDEKLMAVLSESQKKKLEALKGAKFEFPERGGPGGGPGGGRGGAGGRPGGRPGTDN